MSIANLAALLSKPPVRQRKPRTVKPKPVPIPADIKSSQEQQAYLHNEFESLLREEALIFETHSEVERYFPERYGKKIPEEGAWIMVTTIPRTEIRVQQFSMYYAMEVERNYDSRYMVSQHLARILTDEGDLMLWPEEYVVVKDISAYYEFLDEGLIVNWLSEDAAVNPENIFYIRSRGISKKDAFLMLIGEVKERGLCYFTFTPEVRSFFQR